MDDVIALVFLLSFLVAYGFCCYRLSERLGYDGLMGILLLIPLVNFVLMFYWAISESPNEQKIKTLERKLARAKERGPDLGTGEKAAWLDQVQWAKDIGESEDEGEALAELGS